MTRAAVLAAALVLAGAVALAQAPAPRDVTASLDALAWMAGFWTGSEGGTRTEELWLPPAGGVMLGVHRDVSPEGRFFFEYLRIEDTPDGIVYFASPGGRSPATPFALTHSGPQRAVFENPDHDFPQRLEYAVGNGTMTVQADGVVRGEAATRRWTWRREAFPGNR